MLGAGLPAIVAAILGAAPADEGSSRVGSSVREVDVAATLHKYVGTKKCRSCHIDWHTSWESRAKGGSWDALEPGTNAKHKQLVGLAPDKDYTADGQCLACHSVGFGHESGYRIPESDTGVTARRSRQREGASCESCHGPGSGFIKVMRDIMYKERPYKPEELYAAGLRRVTRETCRTCHSLEAPCIKSDENGGTLPTGAVDVSISDREGFHAQFPLKYRTANGSSGGDRTPEDQGNND